MLLLLFLLISSSSAFFHYVEQDGVLPEDVPQPPIKFHTLYELEKTQMAAVGGLSALFDDCKKTEIHKTFKNMSKFILQFLSTRKGHNEVAEYLSNKKRFEGYDAYLANAWRLLWHALTTIDLQNDENNWHNPYAVENPENYEWVTNARGFYRILWKTQKCPRKKLQTPWEHTYFDMNCDYTYMREPRTYFNNRCECRDNFISTKWSEKHHRYLESTIWTNEYRWMTYNGHDCLGPAYTWPNKERKFERECDYRYFEEAYSPYGDPCYCVGRRIYKFEKKPEVSWTKNTLYDNHITEYKTLMFFNLILCANEEHGREYFCPDQCLGVWDKDKKVKKPGNPCANVNYTRSPQCTTDRDWKSVMDYFWRQFDDPESSFAKGEFEWFVNDTSYTCDCKEGYGWNKDELRCDKHMAFFEEKCNPQTHEPCRNAVACKTNRHDGHVECTCKPRYTGSLCEHLRDPCLERTINFTRMTAQGPVSVLANGNDMCNVNMSGLATATEPVGDLLEEVNFIDGSHPTIHRRPKHSTCKGTLGSDNYLCQCQPPFAEDLTIEYPNCLHQKSPCDSKLCIHGTCVTTANSKGKAVCMCYPGYDGRHCSEPADMWTHWSECKPPCGRGRVRSRSRREYIQDEEEHANGQYRTIVQEEECPPRLGDDCPPSLLKHGLVAPDDASYRYMEAKSDLDGPLLQLQAFVAVTVLIFICIVQYLRFLTYMLN